MNPLSRSFLTGALLATLMRGTALATPTSELPCGGKFSCVPASQPLEVGTNVWVSTGQLRSFVFALVDSYEGSAVNIPVTVIRGVNPGPSLLLTAAIHGDELIGVPLILALREWIRPEQLNGVVIMLPVVNPFGFHHQTRMLPDRRDLNRYFPGNPAGSLASRIADRIFRTFALPSDYCLDVHTAAAGQANAPHVRVDPSSSEALKLAQGFGGMVVLHPAEPGTLRLAATQAGVPTVVFEAGETGRIDSTAVEAGVRGVQNLLGHLGMLPAGAAQDGERPLLMQYSPWLRADSGGIVELTVGLGDLVQANQRLLTIRDTLNGDPRELRAPGPGIVLSIARSPVAQPGNALLRLGMIEQAGEEYPDGAENEMPEEE